MKQEDYEIDLGALGALCLIHWKRIGALALAGAALWLAVVTATFQPPEAADPDYQQTRRYLAERSAAEVRLAEARERYDANLFYAMDPQALHTRQLTLAVETEPSASELTDPADLVVYAYHNLARTQLQGRSLVPALLSQAQLEQLLTVEYDTNQNLLLVTMTGDDEALTDSVLAFCAQWYQAQQAAVTEQTHPHRLSILPVSELALTTAQREALVSPLAEEASIRELEQKIAQYSEKLDTLLEKPQGWAAARSAQTLEQALESKQQRDSRPGIPGALLGGSLLGAILGVLWVWGPVQLRGGLPGEEGLLALTDWPCLGRLTPLPSGDWLVRRGYARLYRCPEASRETLTAQTRAMLRLLLADQGLGEPVTVGILGDLPRETLGEAVQSLRGDGLHLEAAPLRDRVEAHRLCRQADVILLAGPLAGLDCRAVAECGRILEPLGKKPLGFFLI